MYVRFCCKVHQSVAHSSADVCNCSTQPSLGNHSPGKCYPHKHAKKKIGCWKNRLAEQNICRSCFCVFNVVQTQLVKCDTLSRFSAVQDPRGDVSFSIWPGTPTGPTDFVQADCEICGRKSWQSPRFMHQVIPAAFQLMWPCCRQSCKNKQFQYFNEAWPWSRVQGPEAREWSKAQITL